MKFVAVAGATALNAVTACACPLCHSPTGEKVREGIFNSEFPMTFVSMVMPFVVIAGVVAVIHHSSPRIAEPRSEAAQPSVQNQRHTTMDNRSMDNRSLEQDRPNRGPLLAAGTLLGVGMGGFVDGIVLHQLLQTHNMVSAKYPKLGVDPETALVNTEINMFWDGLFHAFTWLVTAIGIALLWRAVKRQDVPLSTAALVGSMIFGWGLFNLVEGVIDHHLLHVHHVVERLGVSMWDYAFLGSGVLMILVGGAIMRRNRPLRN